MKWYIPLFLTITTASASLPFLEGKCENPEGKCCLEGKCEPIPCVETELGKVIGNTGEVDNKAYDEYLGIPFAKPPTGKRRFKITEPLKKFSNCSIEATKQPLGCPQPTKLMSMAVPEENQSEDCLFLNIWVPKTSTQENKTVMFFIFGGGFYTGGIGLEDYNGKALAVSGNVIVASVSYRLSVFGFLYTKSKDAPGNAALYDIYYGLKWVRENIAAFGGDPDKITIFGESAGSILISFISASPLFKGMYKRLIMESGTSAQILKNPRKHNLNMGQKVAEKVKCANQSITIFKNAAEVVSCMQTIDAQKLVKAATKSMPDAMTSFQPLFGDAIVPTSPRKKLINGHFHDTDVMIGDPTEEGTFILIMLKHKEFGLAGEKDTLFSKEYGAKLLRKKLAYPKPGPIIKYYLGNVSDDDYEGIRNRTFSAFGDALFTCPDIFTAERYVDEGNNVYFFYFAHAQDADGLAEWVGVEHGAELAFVFGQPILHPEYFTEKERSLSRYVMEKWSNFAKTGNPGDEWPRYSSKDPKVLFFDIQPHDNKFYHVTPQPLNCDVFRPLLGFEDEEDDDV